MIGPDKPQGWVHPSDSMKLEGGHADTDLKHQPVCSGTADFPQSRVEASPQNQILLVSAQKIQSNNWISVKAT